jgi:hypothetical protein
MSEAREEELRTGYSSRRRIGSIGRNRDNILGSGKLASLTRRDRSGERDRPKSPYREGGAQTFRERGERPYRGEERREGSSTRYTPRNGGTRSNRFNDYDNKP